jgi:VWFA-related protein
MLTLAMTMSSQTPQAGQSPAQGSVPGAAMGGQAAAGPTLRTGTNLVLVDVVATNRDQPVHGLDRKAFHVFEDGKEQPITSFDEHQPGGAAAPAFMAASLPANTYTNLPEYPQSSAVNVLLLDALNTPTGDQMRVRRKMIDYLESIKPGTSLAIFTLSSRLRMVTAFTSDPAGLVKSLKAPKANPQQSTLLDAQQPAIAVANAANPVVSSQLTQPTTNGSAASNPSGPLAANLSLTNGPMNAAGSLEQFEADQSAFQSEDRAKITLNAMRELAGYLGGIEGRKNVIWFSGSFPFAIFPDSSLPDPFKNIDTIREEVQKAADLLTAARVAIYAVDARGMTAPQEFSVANSNAFVAPDQALGAQVGKEQEELNNEETTLQEVAEETGGRAYLNDNDLDRAVASAVENGANYYTIAYVPPGEHLDGKYHKIQVSVDGVHGVKLAYRRGYYADGANVPADQGGESSLFADAVAHDAPAATQILFRARVLTASDPLLKGVSVPSGPAGQLPLTGAVHRYVIDLTLDAHGLAFNAGADGSHEAALELAMVAYDANGQRLNFYQHGFQLSLKDAQMERIMGSGIGLRLPFDLPAGQVYLRIGVHDLNANRAGSLEVPLQVGQ